MAEPDPAAEQLAAYLEPFAAAYQQVAARIVEDFSDPQQAYRLIKALDRELKTMQNDQVSDMKAEQVVLDLEEHPRSAERLGLDYGRSRSQIESYKRRVKEKRQRRQEG